MAGRALVNYIGQASLANFRLTMGQLTWGFKNYRPEYGPLRPGDWLLFGVSASGNPRVPPEKLANFDLAEVVVGRLTSALLSDNTPFWPDERGVASYPPGTNLELLDREVPVPLRARLWDLRLSRPCERPEPADRAWSSTPTETYSRS